MVIILKPLWREGCSLMTPASLLSLPDEEEANSFRCTQGILVPSAWVGHLPWAGGPQVRVFFFWLQDRFYAHLWEILFLSSKGKLITTALGSAQGYTGITRHHTSVPSSRQPVVLPVPWDTQMLAWAIHSIIYILSLDLSPERQTFLSYGLLEFPSWVPHRFLKLSSFFLLQWTSFS